MIQGTDKEAMINRIQLLCGHARDCLHRVPATPFFQRDVREAFDPVHPADTLQQDCCGREGSTSITFWI